MKFYFGLTMQEAITRPLSLCAWLGIIADLWSYLLREIIKINEPCGTCWMPPEIYCLGCAFLLLCCWCCQEFFFFFLNKCKWRHGLIVEEKKKALSMLSNTLDRSFPSLPVILFYIIWWHRLLIRIPLYTQAGSIQLTPVMVQEADPNNTAHLRILTQS